MRSALAHLVSRPGFSFSLFILIYLISSGSIWSQTKTIILVRHAEKDISSMADAGDPVLSAAGVQRAERLRALIVKYRPGAVFSTDYKRTLGTAEPIAKKRHIVIQIYDPKNDTELIDRLMKSNTKRFVVVGHSNTIPALANALAKKELFENLNDSEYGVIWIIRLRNGALKSIKLLPY